MCVCVSENSPQIPGSFSSPHPKLSYTPEFVLAKSLTSFDSDLFAVDADNRLEHLQRVERQWQLLVPAFNHIYTVIARICTAYMPSWCVYISYVYRYRAYIYHLHAVIVRICIAYIPTSFVYTTVSSIFSESNGRGSSSSLHSRPLSNELGTCT